MVADLKVSCETANTVDVVSKMIQNIVTQPLVLSYTEEKCLNKEYDHSITHTLHTAHTHTLHTHTHCTHTHTAHTHAHYTHTHTHTHTLQMIKENITIMDTSSCKKLWSLTDCISIDFSGTVACW